MIVTKIETLIGQVEDAKEHAAARKYACTPIQLVNVSHILIFNTRFCHNDCKSCRAKPIAEQTWKIFKTFFSKAHQDLLISSQTHRSTGFQANNVIAGGQGSETEVQALEAIRYSKRGRQVDYSNINGHQCIPSS